MAGSRIDAELVRVLGRRVVKRKEPEVNLTRCLHCGQCVEVCRRLGPSVLEIRNNRVKVARPRDCKGDGACMLACPAKAIFLTSVYDLAPSAPLCDGQYGAAR